MIFHLVKKVGTSFFRFVTMHAFARRRETWLMTKTTVHSMQRGKTV